VETVESKIQAKKKGKESGQSIKKSGRELEGQSKNQERRGERLKGVEHVLERRKKKKT